MKRTWRGANEGRCGGARFGAAPLIVVVMGVALFGAGACEQDPGGGPLGSADASDVARLSAQVLPDEEALETLGVVEVIHVSDGDTMDIVTEDDITETIRFYGVDTPEKDQPFGQDAKAYTEGLLNGGPVEVILLKGQETYGRKVGIVVAGDVVVNAALLDAGHAWFYEAFCREQPTCDNWDALEDAARAARRGLWGTADFVAPWDWRRNH